MANRLIRTAQRLPLWGRIVVLYGLVAVGILSAVLLQPAGPQVRYDEPVPDELQAKTEQVQATMVQTVEPRRLSIDRLGVNLNIRDGLYDAESQQWTLNDTDAFFATVSDPPTSAAGSTFIYGHNRPTAFGPLADLGVEDVVELSDEDGTTFRYAYVRDARVAPSFTEVLYEESDTPQLILMTCEGIFNEVRRVMYFTLVEVV
jgi:sortase (surface protein transpeptidase)